MIPIEKEYLEKFNIVDWGMTNTLEPVSYQEYDNWVAAGKEGPLTYLSDERKEKRRSLDQVFPKVKSALVFLFSYKDVYHHYQSLFGEHRMATYALAYGDRDYHYVIKEQLQLICDDLKEKYPKEEFKGGIDTWPILERDLAFRAGLGWFGKNSMLLNQQEGSLFFIGSILTTLETRSEEKVEVDHCGSCTDCITACPTDALDPKSRTLIADRCISTFTIELFKEAEPPKGMEQSGGEIFGCDICQDVCPWNKKLIKNLNPDPIIKSTIFDFFFNRPLEQVYRELKDWSNKKYVKTFKGTVLERTGRVGMLKNLKFYLKKTF